MFKIHTLKLKKEFQNSIDPSFSEIIQDDVEWYEYKEEKDIKKNFPTKPTSNDIIKLYEISKAKPSLHEFLVIQSKQVR